MDSTSKLVRATGPYLGPPLEFVLGAATDPNIGMQMITSGPGPVKIGGAVSYATARSYQGIAAGWKLIKGLFVEGVAAESIPAINMGKQGKHILGNNNYITGRSVR